MDSNQLKVQALLESMGKKYTEYENTIADLRVAFTQAQEELESLRLECDQKVVEGVVVDGG